MTKRLILFRHGKSDWDTPFGTDHERPVAKRGVKAAKAMGQFLAKAGQLPDAIVTSSAVRAQTTVEIAMEAGRWRCPCQVTDDLYEATSQQVLGVIQQQADTAQTLLLAGHEPTWSTLTAHLMGGGQVNVPTAAMVCLEFEVDRWEQVEFGLGYLAWLVPPKLFTQGDFEFV